MSNVGISLNTRLRLSASPHMQQAVRLLQLSAVEFSQELQQALTQNPFLEEVEDIDTEQESTLESPEQERLDAQADLAVETDDSEPMEAPLDETEAYEAFDPVSAGDLLPASDEPRDPFDFSASAGTASSPGTSSTDASDWACAETSLRSHLLDQICGWGVDARGQMAATVVVESLDDDGYLRGDVDESVAAAGIEPPLSRQEIADAIRFVQSCDPAGVGARNLGECLALQIDALEDEEPAAVLAGAIVRQHLDLVAHHRFAALRQALSCGDEALNEACNLIRRLDPRPGHRFSAQRAEYVIPDVIVRQRGSELVAIVNPAARPSARLNQCYAQWFRAARHQDHPALSQQLQEARWLMHNVEQRFVTIQRVAEAIVRRQRDFFECGEIALKPLVLREVADDLGIHESTVSRATGNKYMVTPRGLFEFRHFFSRSLTTETGVACSAAAVRALMTDMLANEKD
ncbi:MAG: RNA polymerase factor sigma-54, partial [Panacagrimonas sp.]